MAAGIEFAGYVINQLGSPALNSNTFANRPAPGFTGRIFISTDTREIFRDTGTAWELIGSGGSGVNIYNSDGTLTGGRTVNLANNRLTFTDDTTANLTVAIRNNRTPNGTEARLQLAHNGQSAFNVGLTGSTFPGFRTITSNCQFFYGDPGNFTFVGVGGNSRFTVGLDSFTAQFTILNTGRFLFNTTVDAGFTADFNGTVAIRGNTTLFTASSLTLNDSSNTNNARLLHGNTPFRGNQFLFQWTGQNVFGYNLSGINFLNAATNNDFLFIDRQVFSNSSTGGNGFDFLTGGEFRPTTGNNTYNVFSIRTVYNSTGGNNTIRGIFYNPTLTSLIGVNHFAIQTNSGTVENYDRSDLTTSNFSSRNIWTLQSRLRQTLTPGADQFGAGYYTGGLFIRELSISGNNTYGNATINAGGSSTMQIDFTSAGTLTASQAGLRAFAGHQIFNTFGGTASGTITHFAGLQILGLYNRDSGVITPTIQNAYGLVINNLNDYSHTFTLTNRWGIYQTGSSDNNYLAGKLLVGTNTVTARQLHINGNIELTTTLSGTAGGSSGQHLSIWANGTEYKIALLNP
jgi:hypothetical protein